jgi:hypothetical protein
MDEQSPIPVNPNSPKVIYAIPAKPKPAAPWWQENFEWLLVLWGCVVGIFYLLGE